MPRQKIRHVPPDAVGPRNKRYDVDATVESLTATAESAAEAAAAATAESLDDEIDAALAQLGVVQTSEVDLDGRSSGSAIVECPFFEENIGAPVIVTQRPCTPDEDEFGIVLFVGEVLDQRHMRIRWYSPGGTPRKVNISFIVGSL